MPRTDRYLRTSLFMVRIRGGVVLVHPGSSVILLTDALGSRAVARLICGYSEQDVRVWVEAQQQGAGLRVASLVDRLDTIGAITTEAPRGDLRWRIRSALSLLLGRALTLASLVIPLLPFAVLRALLVLLPFTPLVARTVGQIQPYVDANLRASGYSCTRQRWRYGIARSCAAASARTFFMMYLALVLAPERLYRLTAMLFDAESFRELERTLRDTGGGVVTSLHTGLYTGVIPLLGASGWASAVLADTTSLGANVGDDTPPALEVYGRYATILNSHSSMAGKALLARLCAGQLALLAFDAPAQDVVAAATLPCIGFMGRPMYRFDGPAWLAARSGKPLVFEATYQRGGKTVISVWPPLYANPDLPRRAQIEDLTARLYATAEAFLRQHPEAWMAWSYQHDLIVRDGRVAEHGESKDGAVLTST